MNRQFVVFRRITCGRSIDDVMRAAEYSLRSLGGSVYRSGSTITIRNGTVGVSFPFVADFDARMTVLERGSGVYDVECSITMIPNTVFWICAIVGFFCLWFLWGVNVLYFVVDPRSPYEQALQRLEMELATPGSAIPSTFAPSGPQPPSGYPPAPPPFQSYPPMPPTK